VIIPIPAATNRDLESAVLRREFPQNLQQKIPSSESWWKKRRKENKFQIPSTKSQNPNKFQCSKFKILNAGLSVWENQI